MSRKTEGYKRGYEHADFSDLLSELKRSNNCNSGEESNDSRVMDLSIAELSGPVESEYRHRIMSNQKIKYLYSKHSNIIHDKHCPCARAIADEELVWSEEYRPDLQSCSECRIQAYIAASAEDPKEIDLYLQFFEKVAITEAQIRSMYIENTMQTRISSDIMTIWHKEDIWRIKALAKKGHVQLYHNNYIVRKNGIREFTRGFHIQNIACEDTNIGYALSIIKNYEYKAEEYALHSNAANSIVNKKEKQNKVQNLEATTLPLEELLGAPSKPQTLWQKIKEYFLNLIKKKNFFELNGFYLVPEQGYPKHQTVCIYIWMDENGQLSWQAGMYNQKLEQFSVRYGTNVYTIKQNKVIAWKKMTADALALDIVDRSPRSK